MRLSRMFGKTLRDDPSVSELASHRLMIKSGMIHQVASGIYSYMPLAWRSIKKIEEIIRQEMIALGGQELLLALLQPRELWQESGRDDQYGPDMFRLVDRRNRELALPPTNEELLTNIVKTNVNSYRDLPQTLYQIQTKFRDEPRPRGGLIRVREFDMKDAYSFDLDEQGLEVSYQSMIQAYSNIYNRCGLETVMVEADSGAIGGRDSHEFVVLTDTGEDSIIMCSVCNYAANAEKASFEKTGGPIEDNNPLSEVHTPGMETIEDLTRYLQIAPHKTIKTVLYKADGEVIFATIRGDLEVNPVKLKNTLNATNIQLATPQEVQAAGIVGGFASPVGFDKVTKVISDDSVKLGSNFVMGANKRGYHLKNVNQPRDFKNSVITDIALARDGFSCAKCGGLLKSRRGIEVGHIFKLGTKYSTALNAFYRDAKGNNQPIVMGCYGIGIGRLLAATIEQNHDARGIVFPQSIAPYQVNLTALNIADADISKVAEKIYADLTKSGVETLFDDRQESAGVKFNDADLLGLPIRIILSRRNINQDKIEIKRRSSETSELIPLQEVTQIVSDFSAQ